jgi:hypothetical protein
MCSTAASSPAAAGSVAATPDAATGRAVAGIDGLAGRTSVGRCKFDWVPHDPVTIPALIILIGHSMGGFCVLKFSEILQTENIPVSLAVTIDSNPVSDVSLPKTGIFAVAAGDFRQIGFGFGEFGSLETVHKIAKARQLWVFLLVAGVVSPTP